MAIKIGHASADENRRASGGAAGDQTGGEVCIREWYSSPWDVILRPTSDELGDKLAKAMEAACANKHIGYDQLSRNTLYHYATAQNFDLAAIEENCECDCSSLIHVCAIAAGVPLGYALNGHTTWTLANALTATGLFTKLSDPKYLGSDAWLRRGDILLNTDRHVAMALENGALSHLPGVGRDDLGAPETVMLNTLLPLLKEGMESGAVESMQLLLEAHDYYIGPDGADGDFGPNTERGLVDFQEDHGLKPDGECGPLTWAKLING